MTYICKLASWNVSLVINSFYVFLTQEEFKMGYCNCRYHISFCILLRSSNFTHKNNYFFRKKFLFTEICIYINKTKCIIIAISHPSMNKMKGLTRTSSHDAQLILKMALERYVNFILYSIGIST